METPYLVTIKDGSLTTVTFEISGVRPRTLNKERSGNRFERAKFTAETRQLFGLLLKNEQVPKLTGASVSVKLWQKGRLQDTGACMPYVKAAIDGMVDAGMFIDDTGDHVVSINFYAPERAKYDKIVIKVIGEKYDGVVDSSTN